MKFKPLSNYLIDYGGITKLATFSHKENNQNHFYDFDSKFVLTDEFIVFGKITITEIEEDDF